jgi:Na+-driven multidrug efflux pump
MIGYGFATAATTLVGQQLGAGQYGEAKNYAKLSVWLGVGVIILFGVVILLIEEICCE